jgi:hypothetical protein
MAKQQLTFEDLAEMFRKTDMRFQEVALQIERTSQEVGKLGSSIGRIIEHMVKGHIVDKFQALNYVVTRCSQRQEFRDCKGLGISGEIDLLLENGEVAILVEVKTTLETSDVRDHIEQLEKYRYCADLGGTDKRRFVGAVAGAVVADDVAKFAMRKGMYVIVQSGEAVEIVTPPKGFIAKEW